MKTYKDYSQEYEAATQGATAGELVVRRDIWIYCKWTADRGINSPAEAHTAILQEEAELQQHLLNGERLFIGAMRK
jgi:hypothetical protein